MKALVAIILLLSCFAVQSAEHTLRVEITPRFAGAPLFFDSLTNMTRTGQRVSVTRLDFLVSNIALRRSDGTWNENTNTFAFISARQGRTRIELDSVPKGQYAALRFLVGLPAAVNHADPVLIPAGHPLNPELNGLHWSWNGGYVFFALEGARLRSDGQQSGYSYHVATDLQLATVELLLTLDLSRDQEIALSLNVDHVLAQAGAISDVNSSTHSRTDDALADRLRQGIESAFIVERVREMTLKPLVVSANPTNKIEIARGARPFRLTISKSFPRPALPLDNPLTQEGVALGRSLFSEPLLSVNNAQSCSSCHGQGKAFTDGKAVSIGAEGKSGFRNAMALMNLAWKSSFFWDGRASSLREQILQPIQNPIEMHESLSNVVTKLCGTTNYPAAFDRTFGTREITSDRIVRALEQFLLVQVSHNSKFDRVLRGETSFTPGEQRGFELFHTEYDPRRGQFGADCFHCHGGPLFQSQSFANNGLDAEFADSGRYKVTRLQGDAGKFAVPSLRNIAITGPYMHDGRFKTLYEVVEHYATGVKRSATLDPNLAKHPEGGVPLSAIDKRALIAFLETLTDEKFRLRRANLASKSP
jgi:cytochrome c peroxidase